jgi:hypothetical protein
MRKTNRFESQEIDFYFNGEYEAKYNETISHLLHKNVIRRENGTLYTTVKP